jgi:glycosyltransferase involved in cell wall biosynthesis
MSTDLDLSVVVSTCGRLERLTGVLGGLAACDESDQAGWEVIVVDNRPSRCTESVVASFLDRLPIRYVPESMPGASHARNRGIAESIGRTVWFLDDDLCVHKGWLRAVRKALDANPDFSFFGGKIEPDWGGANLPLWFSPDIDGHGGHANLSASYNLGPVSHELAIEQGTLEGNMGIRRHIFAEVGGFRSDLGPSPAWKRGLGEGPDLLNRIWDLGYLGYYVADAAVCHVNTPDRLTVRYVLLWSFAMGRFAQKRKALLHLRKGLHILGYRPKEIVRNLCRVGLNLSIACSLGWFLVPRKRVGCWMILARSVGRFVESFAGRPDPRLDWPDAIAFVGRQEC